MVRITDQALPIRNSVKNFVIIVYVLNITGFFIIIIIIHYLLYAEYLKLYA